MAYLSYSNACRNYDLLAQSVEQLTFNQWVAGSIPAQVIFCADLAQLVEQWTRNA